MHHRNFALFWTGALVSNAGTWMQNVTVPFVLLELTHSAVDTLARAYGDPEDPPLMMAREIAAAGALVAAFASGALTVTVLLVKFGELLNWW